MFWTARKRRRRAGVAVAIIAALALTACASAGDRGGDDGGDAGASEFDPAGVLKYGDDFAAVGFITDPIDFRGHSRTRVWMDLIYDTMFYETPDGSLVPGLATEVEFPDASTFILTLRDDVLFQDGTPFNAEAVKYSWERFIGIGPENITNPALRALQSFEVLGELELRVNLASPVAGEYKNRLLMESLSGLGVVSPTAVAAADAAGEDFRDNPVGTGPYQFVEYVENQKVVLTKFEDYWNPDRQPVGGFEFIQTAAGSPRLAALAGGTIDMAGISATDIPAAEGRGLEVTALPTLYTMGIQFCSTRAPFDSLEARQAVVHALDPVEINELTFAGQGALTQLPVPPNSSHAVPGLVDRYEFDPELAEELLAEAGVSEGTTIRLGTDSREQVYIATAELIQSRLQEVGLNVEIEPYQNPLTLNETQPDIAVFRTTWPLHASFLPGTPLNFCGYDSAGFTDNFPITRSIDATEAETDAAYTAALQTLSDDLPTWWFYSLSEFQAHTDKVVANPGFTFQLSSFGQPDLTSFSMRK
ncbi:ABC transporter substrate-binding protein [Microbacterium sp. zg.B48]|uniref:ABC transporter substrate-binding protein n=1 Tax=Microbacterium sp. zg.B48 TaxID=2969408 RepID=UPI00214CC3C1|nr:ABC transporter substrate-binding protein [Microbacterium sp. zg.B48]